MFYFDLKGFLTTCKFAVNISSIMLVLEYFAASYMSVMIFNYTLHSFDFVELEWKALPTTMDKKFDDPEQIPIPEFSAIVDRCMWENKSQEVWDMVRIY